ncbi:MAG TPA: hypothetical protein VKC59_00170 [Candidatus Limnocylindrales bacterium]|nr:hypothetical protein [Candidatus Limnocylindrales bacterium]
MSKRHQSNRRRQYGRRLHEVHERHDRRPERDRLEPGWGAGSEGGGQLGPLTFVDSRAARTRFGFAD